MRRVETWFFLGLIALGAGAAIAWGFPATRNCAAPARYLLCW